MGYTLNANSVLFVCEGRLEPKEFVGPVVSLLEREAEKVLVSTQQHLARTLKDKILRVELSEKIKNPEVFEPKQRVLM